MILLWKKTLSLKVIPRQIAYELPAMIYNIQPKLGVIK